jgi:hypothetical protein|nr:MAG TPA: hypothetical protein [Caudoviricetes sp.]
MSIFVEQMQVIDTCGFAIVKLRIPSDDGGNISAELALRNYHKKESYLELRRHVHDTGRKFTKDNISLSEKRELSDLFKSKTWENLRSRLFFERNQEFLAVRKADFRDLYLWKFVTRYYSEYIDIIKVECISDNTEKQQALTEKDFFRKGERVIMGCLMGHIVKDVISPKKRDFPVKLVI